MTNKEKVKDMFADAVCTIDPFGVQWEVKAILNHQIIIDKRIFGGKVPVVLGTSPSSEEEAWEYAWQGINEIMLKKLEQ